MSNNAFVVVFPSIFSKNKINSLIFNIKKVLILRNQQFSKIKRDNSIIIISANDPVFASSTINLLFGIDRIAIAKKVKNEFNTVVSAITKIGANLLLKGDKFLVKVEGQSEGFMTKDVELAATSSLIEKTGDLGTKPGTQDKHDKLLYTYLTKSNAYVCIYTDKGLGGIPYNSQKQKSVCCIFDELSAVSCIETIREGFDVKIIVCYRNSANLVNIVKMLNRILPRTIQQKIILEFFKVDIKGGGIQSFSFFIETVTEILSNTAKVNKINRISLPLTPLIHPTTFSDSLILP